MRHFSRIISSSTTTSCSLSSSLTEPAVYICVLGSKWGESRELNGVGCRPFNRLLRTQGVYVAFDGLNGREIKVVNKLIV